MKVLKALSTLGVTALVVMPSVATKPAGVVISRGTGSVAAGDVPVSVWITTRDERLLLTPSAPAVFGTTSGTAAFTIDIADDQVFQRMVGFGASLTESSAWLLYNTLDQSTRSALLRQLFSPTTGIGLSFLRQPIGASDFSLSHYSYDDLPAGQTDFPLARFSIARDRTYIIPSLLEAKRLNPRLSIMGTPWSPPGWMKTSGSMIGGSLKTDAYSAFAAYLVKFVQAYAAEGVPVQSVTLQNEPRFVPADYPGMHMSPQQQAVLIARHVGPAFAAAGLQTQIFVWDHNWNEPEYAVAVLQDPEAGRFATGSAFHCYAGQPEAMSIVHDSHPDKSLYMTECSSGFWGPRDFGGSLITNVRTLIIRGTRNWAEAIVKWNLVLDENDGPHTGGCTNCTGVATIQRATRTFRLTADYYALGHASRFVVPGARRVGSTTFESQGLETVAFVNPDGSHALIALNTSSLARRVNVVWNGQSFRYDLPAGAVATFTWPSLASTPFGGTPHAVPGVVEAEDFDEGGQGVAYRDDSAGNNGGVYRATDVDVQVSSEGYNVGWWGPGEWLAYSVDVRAAGDYVLEARVASSGAGGTFHVEFGGSDKTGPLSIPGTGGWQTWTTVRRTVRLLAGQQVMRIVADSRGPGGATGNIDLVRMVAATPSAGTPFGGTARAVPGTIEAEDFNDGGQGVAYRDDSTGNSGGVYRATDVDVQVSSEGYNVGWWGPGEWLAYSVDVAAAGDYILEARVASNGVGGTFHVEFAGADKTGLVAIPNTGGWQQWATVTRPVRLAAGPQIMRVVADGGGAGGATGNLNFLRLRTAPAAVGTPFGGTPRAVPGVIEAEHFDEGGQGIAYRDTSAGNAGGTYRQTDVDLQVSTEGTFNVGWWMPGEWLAYTVDVDAAGDYVVEARVASNGVGGTFHMEFAGADETGLIAIPNTGSWQKWATVTRTVRLAAGPQVMRVVADSGGASGATGNLNFVRVRRP
jgi:glucosylceramidase